MNFTEYQILATRTLPKEVIKSKLYSNMAMGLAGESGEVIDLLKKHVHHGHELDTNKVAEELGDLLWYVSNLATLADLSLHQIAQYNVQKLNKRYPDGFSQEKSINREL